MAAGAVTQPKSPKNKKNSRVHRPTACSMQPVHSTAGLLQNVHNERSGTIMMHQICSQKRSVIARPGHGVAGDGQCHVRAVYAHTLDPKH